MRRGTNRERGLLFAAASLLATLALAGCESVEDPEIRTLIEEIAALQEQRIGVMESTAEEDIGDAREHAPATVAQKEQEWEERLQAARRGHDSTLTKLREASASGDWEAAYPEDSALLEPVQIVRFILSSRQRDLRQAEGYRAGQAAWRERRAEIRRGREAAIEAAKRLPSLPRTEAPNVQDVLKRLNRNEPE